MEDSTGMVVGKHDKGSGDRGAEDARQRVVAYCSVWRALQKCRNDKDAGFKSVEQGKAWQLIVDAKIDVLAILPTVALFALAIFAVRKVKIKFDFGWH
jgi:hypothetical protein